MMPEQELRARIRVLDDEVERLTTLVNNHKWHIDQHERRYKALQRLFEAAQRQAAVLADDRPVENATMYIGAQIAELTTAIKAAHILAKREPFHCDERGAVKVTFDRLCNRCKRRDVSVEQICAACLAERVTEPATPDRSRG